VTVAPAAKVDGAGSKKASLSRKVDPKSAGGRGSRSQEGDVILEGWKSVANPGDVR